MTSMSVSRPARDRTTIHARTLRKRVYPCPGCTIENVGKVGAKIQCQNCSTLYIPVNDKVAWIRVKVGDIADVFVPYYGRIGAK